MMITVGSAFVTPHRRAALRKQLMVPTYSLVFTTRTHKPLHRSPCFLTPFSAAGDLTKPQARLATAWSADYRDFRKSQ